MKRRNINAEIVSEILDGGLAESTWRETYPEAYQELLKYRQDMIADVASVRSRTLNKR